ncbi:MAG: nitrite reductase small subunit NirD [Gammaproteobacteria bacterium]|nr:nitrite reductase small subunit NirD [Gammaproteobacteria bacterium]MDH5778239.1 nitrite reductase small subunit NirD [Gammaproteobacteria bacterium]
MSAVKKEDKNWIEVGQIDDVPKLGARVIKTDDGNIGLFRTADDEIFALRDECPHKKGPLSQGIVHGKKVTCPLHNWNINLDSGEAVAPDEGCTASFPIKIEGSTIYIAI